MKKFFYMIWMIYECGMMFFGTTFLLLNIHLVIPALKLREWSVVLCVIMPAMLVLFLTVTMQCGGYYTIERKKGDCRRRDQSGGV